MDPAGTPPGGRLRAGGIAFPPSLRVPPDWVITLTGMDVELAAGFAAVIVSLLAIAFLVFASHKIIEKTHRKNLSALQGTDPGGEDNGNRGDAR